MDNQYLAQLNATTIPSYFAPAQNVRNFGDIINFVIPAVQFIGALIFLAMLFYAAYKFLSGGGEAENIQEAQKTATYAIIGLIFVAISFFIVRLIAYISGVDIGF